MSKIGFSFVFVDSLAIANNCSIGNGSIIKCDSINMKDNAYIGRLNILYGPFKIILCKFAAIGNNNKITRGPKFSTNEHRSFIRLGELSKITANHRIDVTRSIYFGKYTTLAGTNSEMWTHGYVHAESGPERYRVDGPIILKNNVYIGSRSLITSGVSIESSIQVGAGSVVSKSLHEKGYYVSQGLRALPLPKDPSYRDDLQLDKSCNKEIIFIKKK